jgi:uncharacterized protein UPF0158
MTRRRLTIDRDDLEMALTWRDPEGGHYLDLTTGEILFWSRGGDGPSEEEMDGGVTEGRLIAIEPLPSSVEYGWMEEFAAALGDSDLRHRLDAALAGHRPFRRFKDVLADFPADREAWFAFHAERTRAAAREWLDDHGVEMEDAPARGRPSDDRREN